MEIDIRALIIAALCVVLGTLMMLLGIVTSEIEIRRNQYEAMYDQIDN